MEELADMIFLKIGRHGQLNMCSNYPCETLQTPDTPKTLPPLGP